MQYPLPQVGFVVTAVLPSPCPIQMQVKILQTVENYSSTPAPDSFSQDMSPRKPHPGQRGPTR